MHSEAYNTGDMLMEFTVYVTYARRVFINLNYDSAIMNLEFYITDLHGNIVRLSTLATDYT